MLQEWDHSWADKQGVGDTPSMRVRTPLGRGEEPRGVAEAGPIPQQCSKGMGRANKHGRRRWGGPWPDLSGPEQGQGPASVWALRAAPGRDILGLPWPLLLPQPVRNLPGTSAS